MPCSACTRRWWTASASPTSGSRGGSRPGGELLQLVIHDSWFVWLRPVSELIVRLDGLLEGDEPVIAGEGPGVIAEVRELLTPAEGGPGFATHYFEALQRDPAVVLAHADVMRALPAAGQ
jgi:hypothetical protein